jgi:hypothetical protein
MILGAWSDFVRAGIATNVSAAKKTGKWYQPGNITIDTDATRQEERPREEKILSP